MAETLRLSMWSGPRNVSTALMYSFRQRPDTKVYDEPLYGHYLAHTGAEHPGRFEVMEDMDTDADTVIRRDILGPHDEAVVFFKNMAHHIAGLDRSFLDRVTNVFLVRDPRLMLPSLAEQIPVPTLRDTGLSEQAGMVSHVLASGDTPVVLDSKVLLDDPEGVLTELCHRLDIPFYREMLSWPAGAKPEDGVWAEYWYDSVHASTGFAAPRRESREFPEHLQPLLGECLPLYERLREYAIPPSG